MPSQNNAISTASRVSAISSALSQQAPGLRQVSLKDLSYRGKYILWGDLNNSAFTAAILEHTGLKLPRQSGDVFENTTYRAIWANPKRWYLICEQDDEEALAKALADSGQVHMSVTDGQACFQLEGEASIDLLKKGCSLNFNLEHFPPGQCLQTRLAITKVFIHRHNASQFDIYVERSYAEYIWSWLVDAAREFKN